MKLKTFLLYWNESTWSTLLISFTNDLITLLHKRNNLKKIEVPFCIQSKNKNDTLLSSYSSDPYHPVLRPVEVLQNLKQKNPIMGKKYLPSFKTHMTSECTLYDWYSPNELWIILNDTHWQSLLLATE